MKIIKTYKNYILKESATRNEIADFLNDFGFFITMNLSKISSYSSDDNNKKELDEMQKNIRKPLINGKTYTELLNDMNIIINNPKYLSTLLSQIKSLLEYIEPRITKYVDDGEIKNKWLKRIEDLKSKYIKIIK